MAKQELTCDDILKELRAKQYRPIYYLMLVSFLLFYIAKNQSQLLTIDFSSIFIQL